MGHDDMTDKPDMCAALRKWADRLRGENATMAEELEGYADAWEAERVTQDLCRQELQFIALAKRFDSDAFRDDTDFADWAQTRCRFTLEKTQ
jgi:hypothetical protein